MEQGTISGMLHGELITVRQVNIRTAKKLFIQGKTIYIISSKMKPFNVWAPICPINHNTDQIEPAEAQFAQITNSYQYYNCTPETGKSIKFYTPAN